MPGKRDQNILLEITHHHPHGVPPELFPEADQTLLSMLGTLEARGWDPQHREGASLMHAMRAAPGSLLAHCLARDAIRQTVRRYELVGRWELSKGRTGGDIEIGLMGARGWLAANQERLCAAYEAPTTSPEPVGDPA